MITIKKAIELVVDYQKRRAINRQDDVQEALKLGIEALRRIKDARTDEVEVGKGLLPGETKED